MTISQELRSRWETLIQRGDLRKIAAESQIAYHKIHRAVKYGDIRDEAVVDAIQKFLIARRDRNQERLNELSA